MFLGKLDAGSMGWKPLARQQVPCAFLSGSSWRTPCVSDCVNDTSLFISTLYTKRSYFNFELCFWYDKKTEKKWSGGFHQDKYDPSAMSHIVLSIAVQAWLGRQTRRQEVNVGHWSSTNWCHLDQLLPRKSLQDLFSRHDMPWLFKMIWTYWLIHRYHKTYITRPKSIEVSTKCLPILANYQDTTWWVIRRMGECSQNGFWARIVAKLFQETPHEMRRSGQMPQGFVHEF